MKSEDIIPVIISTIALLVSGFTAYKTFLARFSGKVWPTTRMVITHVGEVPSMKVWPAYSKIQARKWDS